MSQQDPHRTWLERLTRASPDVMAVLDPARDDALYVNRTAEDAADAWLASLAASPRRLLDRCLPAERTAVERFCEALAAARPVEDLTCRVATDGAGTRWVHARAAALDPDDGAARLFVAMRDVTAQRESKHALVASEARLGLALEAGGAAAYTLAWRDDGPSFVELRGARHLVGDVALPRPLAWWTARVHPDDLARVEAHHEGLRRPGLPRHAKIRYRVRGGASRWIHVEDHARAEPEEDGRVAQVLGVLLDVEAHYRFEARLRELDRQKDAFLAMLGHELRNPLAAIYAAAELLEADGGGSARAARARAVVARQAKHMRRLVDALLDVSLALRGGLPLERTPLDLSEVVQHAMEDRGAELQASGLDVQLTLAPRVPVEGDATRLTQLVDNLVSNALKFTPPPGRVRVATRSEGEHAWLTVEDTGIGLDPGVADQLFEPFRQGKQRIDRPLGGLGLGLALVREIARLHGGEVEAHSEGEGRGTRFTVRLPRAGAGSGASPAPRPPRPQPGRRRVLLVEDNDDAASMLAELLEQLGHEVVAARDGEAALARIGERFDLVLCDLGLPGEVDGFGVAQALREAWGDGAPRLVAVTGYGQPEDRARAIAAGFDAHVVKPIPLETLASLLDAP